MQLISRFILKIMGWKVTGFDPGDLKKCILIVVPHTSAWDFPLGLLVRSKLGADIKFIGKEELFKGWKGIGSRFFGGIPVKRNEHSSFVEDVAEIFNSREVFRICLAPEGTRKAVTKLKSGFHRIAIAANVPVILVKWDFGNKNINFSEPWHMTDNKADDMKKVEDYFRGVIGKVPEYSFL